MKDSKVTNLSLSFDNLIRMCDSPAHGLGKTENGLPIERVKERHLEQMFITLFHVLGMYIFWQRLQHLLIFVKLKRLFDLIRFFDKVTYFRL